MSASDMSCAALQDFAVTGFFFQGLPSLLEHTHHVCTQAEFVMHALTSALLLLTMVE